MLGYDKVLGAEILGSCNNIVRQVFTSVRMEKRQPFKRP